MAQPQKYIQDRNVWFWALEAAAMASSWRTVQAGKVHLGKVSLLSSLLFHLGHHSKQISELKWLLILLNLSPWGQIHYLRNHFGTSLVAQWLRICLPMQGTRVRSLVQEDPTCHGATKPMCHNYWACALQPVSHDYWASEPQLLDPHATATEAHVPRACVLQQEKPPKWEARAPQRRVSPTRRN